MDTAPAQWPQDIVVKAMEEIAKPSSSSVEISRKARPQKEQALNCPRCNSTNTKFCYYNNYSLTQPRYFCKTCRRYWTEGGSLRSIPVGGGSRKNKRSSSSSSSSNRSSSSPKIKLPDLVPQQQNPNKNINILDHHHHHPHHQNQDLNLGFSIHHHHDFKAITDMIRVPNFDNKLELQNNDPSDHELLTTSRGLMNSFMSFPVVANNDPNAVYSSGFPSLNFSLDGLGSNYGSFQGVEETNGKLLFPFEDLKQDGDDDSTRNDDGAQQSRDAATTGFWNGVIGGGSW